jgi:hypothetical protein
MITKDVSTENPSEHWEFVECDNQIALDLGCGRWEKVEFRDQSWPTTPEYLIQRGASHVYAFDIDNEEIEWYTNNITPKMNVTAIHKHITSVTDIRHMLETYNPTVIKCDIEGAESVFLELTDEEFTKVKFYALETHSDALHHRFTEQFSRLGYTIVANINLVHAPPMKAIFARKD